MLIQVQAQAAEFRFEPYYATRGSMAHSHGLCFQPTGDVTINMLAKIGGNNCRTVFCSQRRKRTKYNDVYCLEKYKSSGLVIMDKSLC